jgi:muconolactone delta-isomerase
MFAIENTPQTHGKLLSKPNVSSWMNSLATLRIVGKRANFSIWDVDSLEELHESFQSLPMFPWMDITVTPLIEHPSEIEYKKQNGEMPPLDD